MTPTILTVLGTILVAAITVAGSTLSFHLTKRHEQKMKWQQEKLNHYRDLLSSFSDLWSEYVRGVTGNDETYKRFTLAVNTLGLVAPQNVIAAIEALTNSLILKKGKIDQQEWDSLLLAARQDIGLSSTDDIGNVRFPLVAFTSPDSRAKQTPTSHSDP